MTQVSITLSPDQESALREKYRSFCENLSNLDQNYPLPTLEQFAVSVLVGQKFSAYEMARELEKTGISSYIKARQEKIIPDFVLAFFRSARLYGFGFTKSSTQSQDQTQKGVDFYVDSIQESLNGALTEFEIEQLKSELPNFIYPVEWLYPEETFASFCNKTRDFLSDCLDKFNETNDIKNVEVAFSVLEFASKTRLFDGKTQSYWESHLSDIKKRFDDHQSFHMTWLDLLFQKITFRRKKQIARTYI